MATCLALASCGTGTEESTTSAPATVVATTSIWADITSNITCGEPVATLVPAGADPHAFEPSLRDRAVLDAAELVVANGAGLEERLVDLLTTAADDDTSVVEMASHIDLITGAGDDHDDDHDDDADDVADRDPHIWLDPKRVAGSLDVIAAALIADDHDATEIERCLSDYRAELTALDAELAQLVDALPPESRVLVTNHDALGYLADRYGFEVVGTVIPSTSSMAESDAATLEVIAETIRERNVPAIFTEESEASADAEALADRLGVAVVPLVSGSLAPDGPASTYTGMMRALTTDIVEALAP